MNKRKSLKKLGVYVGAVILVAWSVLPVVWMFISSITPSNQVVDSSILLPTEFTFDRYKMIFTGAQIEGVNRNAAAQSAVFRHALLNSSIVAVVTTGVSIMIGASASYAFARMKFRGNAALRFSALFFQLLPPIALLIPEM